MSFNKECPSIYAVLAEYDAPDAFGALTKEEISKLQSIKRTKVLKQAKGLIRKRRHYKLRK